MLLSLRAVCATIGFWSGPCIGSFGTLTLQESRPLAFVLSISEDVPSTLWTYSVISTCPLYRHCRGQVRIGRVNTRQSGIRKLENTTFSSLSNSSKKWWQFPRPFSHGSRKRPRPKRQAALHGIGDFTNKTPPTSANAAAMQRSRNPGWATVPVNHKTAAFSRLKSRVITQELKSCQGMALSISLTPDPVSRASFQAHNLSDKAMGRSGLQHRP